MKKHALMLLALSGSASAQSVDLYSQVAQFCLAMGCERREPRFQVMPEASDVIVTRFALKAAPGTAVELYFDRRTQNYFRAALFLPREFNGPPYNGATALFFRSLKAGDPTPARAFDCLNSVIDEGGIPTDYGVGQVRVRCSLDGNGAVGSKMQPSIFITKQ